VRCLNIHGGNFCFDSEDQISHGEVEERNADVVMVRDRSVSDYKIDSGGEGKLGNGKLELEFFKLKRFNWIDRNFRPSTNKFRSFSMKKLYEVIVVDRSSDVEFVEN
jgi:hypothetical protein